MDNNNNIRVYHGNIRAVDIARTLKGEFHRGNYVVQTYGKPEQIILQIATKQQLRSGGQTALTLHLNDTDDGVMVSVQKQKWLGIAASIGTSAIATVINPWNLLSRIDDIAQDIESITMIDDIWHVVEKRVLLAGAGKQLSQRFRRVTCQYCGSAIKTGEASCIACGAPLGESQPVTCQQCGFVCSPTDTICPNCHHPL
jgi:hypothetical protein